MIAKSIKIGALAFGAVLLSLGVVQAQSGSPNSASPASPPKEDSANKSPQQILDEGRLSLDRMEATADNISRMLREARKAKDVVKTLCLDDKLNQINVAARSAADRVTSIEAAVVSGNAERARHDDAVLGALSARGIEIAAEANQCIGEEAGVLGDTLLEVTFDPAIPKQDTATPQPPTLISSPPVAASPTM
jgi:hypothetical protein